MQMAIRYKWNTYGCWMYTVQSGMYALTTLMFSLTQKLPELFASYPECAKGGVVWMVLNIICIILTVPFFVVELREVSEIFLICFCETVFQPCAFTFAPKGTHAWHNTHAHTHTFYHALPFPSSRFWMTDGVHILSISRTICTCTVVSESGCQLLCGRNMATRLQH